MIILIRPRPPGFAGLWCNKYSSVDENGPIVAFLASLQSNKTLAIPHSDGIHRPEEVPLEWQANSQLLIGALCSRRFPGIEKLEGRLIYIPLDDEIFQLGLKAVLERDVPNLYLPWEDRQPKLFWRGTLYPLRNKVVTHLIGFPHADVKFMPTIYNQSSDWVSPEVYDPVKYPSVYSHKCYHAHKPLSEFVKHKYLLIIDGGIIASGLQWVFGSGSVPVIITHPDNQFWFKQYLEPWINYVPIDYELSDLKGNIQRLVDNDDLARTIAQNARTLAETIFSPEYQRRSLTEAIARD